MNRRCAVLAALCALGVSPSAVAQTAIDLRTVQGTDVKILEDYHGPPDEHGVMDVYPLDLPRFDSAVYYASGWWPAGGNRVYPTVTRDFEEIEEGGIFVLLKLDDGDYLAVLPIGGPCAYTWLAADNGSLVLKLGTHGNAAISGDIPLVAWARADNPYDACYSAWQSALHSAPIKGAALMREEKEYPEVFEYLGWCSWEHYHGKVDEENMVQAMADIEASGVPVRYFLVDNGHFDQQSLAPHAEKFPNGYRPLTDRRSNEGIRWVGIWYGFLGASHGIASPGDLGQFRKLMLESASGTLLPKPTEEAAKAFYEYLVHFAQADDVDFLKVDFQVDALPLYAGLTSGKPTLGGLPPDTRDAVANPYAAAANLSRAFEAVTEDKMQGLINCNWHNAPCLFNLKSSVAGRCSEDYKAGNLEKARWHLYHSYSSTPWLGQIAWGDHDMFHSSDPFAGRMMAVSKAMSGAPVYLSDEPSHFVPEAIYPLTYQDGRLLRPLAPAAPLEDDLFYTPGDGGLFCAVAPLANKTAAIVVYNLEGGVGDDEEVLSTVITPRDYAQASGMIQPYPGEWDIPAEGLVVYDWYQGIARKLGNGHKVVIRGFGDRLLQVSPIENGWAVVGRADKYLSAAAVNVLSVKPNELRITMTESGPLAVWSDRGVPKADGVTFVDAGGGLYQADLAVGKKNRTITISR